MLKIVIIEDEPAIARNLQFSLQELEAMSIQATLGSVKEAVEWLGQHPHAYDLIFMDIRLSDGLSFEIFGQTPVNSPVIFVTAYDEYALQAFRTNGIGYILKPFSNQDLAQAIQKFRQLNRSAGLTGLTQPTPEDPAIPPSELLRITQQLAAAYAGFKQSFLIHYRDKLIPLATKEIAYIHSVNEVSQAQTFGNKKIIIGFTLEQLQQQLDPRDFFRANRQFIVHRRAIREVDFYFSGRLLLKLDPAAPENVLISKARVPEFKQWMNY